MKKNVVNNYFYNLSYQILLAIFPFILIPYLSRTLGPTSTGIFSYSLSITSYFILFGCLGINLYGQNEIAYVRDDNNLKSKKFYEIFLLKSLALIVSLIIFYFTFCMSGKYSVYFQIFLLEIVSNIIDINWFFQGLEEFKIIMIRNMIVKVLSFILIIMFVKTPSDLSKYIVIYCLSNVLGNLSLWISLFKNLVKISLKSINIFSNLKGILALFIPQVAIQIYTVLDKTMLGALTTDISYVGYYEYGQRLVQTILLIFTSIGIVMLPRISNLYSKKETKKIHDMITSVMNIVLLLAIPLIIGLIIMSGDIVDLLLGNNYDLTKKVLIYMSPILLFIGLSNTLGYQYFIPTKKNKYYTASVIVGSIVNVIFNFILIPKYNVVGAAIATSISEFSVLLVQIAFSIKDFDFVTIFTRIIKKLIAATFMAGSLIGLGCISMPLIAGFIIKLLIGILVYFVVLFILNDDTVKIDSIRKVMKG